MRLAELARSGGAAGEIDLRAASAAAGDDDSRRWRWQAVLTFRVSECGMGTTGLGTTGAMSEAVC